MDKNFKPEKNYKQVFLLVVKRLENEKSPKHFPNIGAGGTFHFDIENIKSIEGEIRIGGKKPKVHISHTL